MAGYAREPRAYELMVILLPELADEDLTGAMDRVSTYITDQQGAIKEILSDSPWGRRRLAYTIRFNGQDYRDGYYAIWHFDLEPSRMTEVERELKLDTRVIRYLVVHDDPKWGSPNDGNQPAGETAAEGAVATAVIAEAAAEEAVTTAVVAEAVAEEAVAEAVVAEAVAEEVIAEGAGDDVVIEAVAEAIDAEVVAEEAVAEAVAAEAVAEEAVAEAVVADVVAEEAVAESDEK